MLCRAGAIELCRTFDNINMDYPNKIKVVGIGLEMTGYEEFKREKYFSHDIYIDKTKAIYKAMKYKKPGMLSCWGMCVKSFLEKQKNVLENHKDRKFTVTFDLKRDLFQNGGSLLIDSKGQILLEHMDSYYGDHVKEADIIEAIQNYYN